jgi:hypothetical protein
MSNPAAIQAFITKWQLSGAAERANAQLFLAELCDVLGVPRPKPKQADEQNNAYVFEKVIVTANGTSNFIDLYKRGCFVLETKQGVDERSAHEGSPVSAQGEERQRNLKKGHGVRGTKGWDTAMLRAREQAQRCPKKRSPKAARPSSPWWMWATASPSSRTGAVWAASMCPSPIPPAIALR